MTSNTKTFEAGSHTTQTIDFIMCSIFFVLIQAGLHDHCLTPVIQDNIWGFYSFFLYLDNIYIYICTKNIYAYFFFLFLFLQFHVIYKTGQQNNL